MLLYALAHPVVSNLTTSTFNDANTTIWDPITHECIKVDSCRTITNIVQSCLSVIFICTWVAIHPNIPFVGTHPVVTIFDNFILMVIALLAPELLMLWAMRQWFSANRISRKYAKYGWGKPHAFFILMGGFALYDGDKFCRYLWDEAESDDETLFEQIEREDRRQYREAFGHFADTDNDSVDDLDKIDSETLYDADIHLTIQKSGTDSEACGTESMCLLEFLIAKGYITVTADEIKDRSHADIISKSIAIIQALWFLMQVLARAIEGLAVTEFEIMTMGFALLNFGIYFLWWNKPLRVQYPICVNWRRRESILEPSPSRSTGTWLNEGVAGIFKNVYLETFAEEWPSIFQCFIFPLFLISHIINICAFLIGADHSYDILEVMFSTRLRKDPLRLYIANYFIAGLFGAIHCIPWDFIFPTSLERTLWRTAAVAVAAAPIAMGLIHLYGKVLVKATPGWLDRVFVVVSFALAITYITARITLMVLALMGLRAPQLTAHENIAWLSFVPHIG